MMNATEKPNIMRSIWNWMKKHPIITCAIIAAIITASVFSCGAALAPIAFASVVSIAPYLVVGVMMPYTLLVGPLLFYSIPLPKNKSERIKYASETIKYAIGGHLVPSLCLLGAAILASSYPAIGVVMSLVVVGAAVGGACARWVKKWREKKSSHAFVELNEFSTNKTPPENQKESTYRNVLQNLPACERQNRQDDSVFCIRVPMISSDSAEESIPVKNVPAWQPSLRSFSM